MGKMEICLEHALLFHISHDTETVRKKKLRSE